MRNRNWGNKIANESVNKIYAGGAANRGGGGGGVRTWLVIEKGGKCETVEVGKHAIMKRAGLPARDLRMLEPALSYPSTILGRERAIVFNVEHIKAIITCSEILLLNSRDPAVSPFARTLVQRLSPSPSLRPAFHEHGMNDEMEGANPASRSPQSEINEHSEGGFSRDHLTTALEGFGNRNLNVLPFEFRALEACLEESCNCLERETTTLEQEAYPALDELTTTISTLNLERVRQIKSRLVAVSGRIQKVRDELEHLLDDDGDMAEMYLTNKMLQQQLDEEFSSYSFNLNKVENHSSQLDMANGSEHAGDDEKDNDSDSAASSSHQSSHSDDDSGSKHFNVEELEMLLEAYFVQIDGTLNKLSALREYVDDTEDYINIMLDDKQNQLLRMGVMLSTINLLINCCIVVVGVFGMNIHVQLFEREHAGLLQFVTTVCGSFGGGVIMYCCAIGWYRKRGLLG